MLARSIEGAIFQVMLAYAYSEATVGIADQEFRQRYYRRGARLLVRRP
jgi:hypothetical protein